MIEPTPPVAILMGSQSDWATLRHAADTLDSLGIGHDDRIISAHRTPDRLITFCKGARRAGYKVIIAGAGGAAHLPGMTAAMTPLPVFGVPVESKALGGLDSLYSIVQMPAGIPVGTLAIGRAGAINAALLAAAILALSDDVSPSRLEAGAPHRRPRSTSARPTMSEAPPLRPGMIVAFSAAASSAACWRSPPPSSVLPAISSARPEEPGLRRRRGRAPSPPMTTRPRSPPSPTPSMSSPSSSRTSPPRRALPGRARRRAARLARRSIDPGPAGREALRRARHRRSRRSPNCRQQADIYSALAKPAGRRAEDPPPRL